MQKMLATGLGCAAALGISMNAVLASSHMDAPSITQDDPANTTDVYAFVSQDADGRQYLTTALAVYPFEEPGIGPNAYRFDDDVRYAIHVATGDDIAAGRASVTYEFDFTTTYKNDGTILQAYLGPLAPPAPGTFADNQNLRQTYTVTRTLARGNNGKGSGPRTILGKGLIVPPNNQGLVTRFYNQGDNGNAPAREGVSSTAALDPFTRSGVAELEGGYEVFAGQRDDGFYADIQSIFDLDFSFAGPAKPFDSQGGYNVHTIVLNIPLDQLDGVDIAGVFATTSRRRANSNNYDQIGRQGNPLFVEALLPISVKDRYNENSPAIDGEFRDFAANPQLAAVLGATPIIPGLLESIFIPDLIKVDLTTGPVPLSGETAFNRLSVFGGDVLQSQVQDPFANGGFIPAGWPNGRRFGDDVVDIAIIAIGAAPPGAATNVDGVTDNEITYNLVFPYAATPLNGRNHGHHGDDSGAP